MGRRKKAVKKVVKKKRPTVAKVFKCLFCNHDKAVQCSLDHKTMTGMLQCSVCNARYNTNINKLTEPIDIFTEWLDEAANAQMKAAKKFSSQPASISRDQIEAEDVGNEFIVEGDEEEE